MDKLKRLQDVLQKYRGYQDGGVDSSLSDLYNRYKQFSSQRSEQPSAVDELLAPLSSPELNKEPNMTYGTPAPTDTPVEIEELPKQPESLDLSTVRDPFLKPVSNQTIKTTPAKPLEEKSSDPNKTIAASIDALTALSNIVNRNQIYGGGVQLEANQLQKLKDQEEKARKAKLEQEKSQLEKDRERRLEEFNKAQLALQEKSLEGYREDRSLRREELKERKDIERADRIDSKIYQVSKDFEGNALKKAFDKQSLGLQESSLLIDEIKKGNQVAMGALGTKMARAMGEVGVLTDADVKRYIEAQSIIDKSKDSAGRLIRGRVSDKTLKDIEELSKKMIKGYETKVQPIYDKYANRAYENFGKASGLSKEDIYQRLDFPLPKVKQQPSTIQSKMVKVIPPNGGTPKLIPQDKLDAALAAGGKLVE